MKWGASHKKAYDGGQFIINFKNFWSAKAEIYKDILEIFQILKEKHRVFKNFVGADAIPCLPLNPSLLLPLGLSMHEDQQR